MIIENGAEEAANDIALPEDMPPELVDVIYDGRSYQLPPELKDALLRQADYTRKIQEVAEGRKALEAAQAEHHESVAHVRAHILDAARIVALNDQLEQFSQVDWRALQARDPSQATRCNSSSNTPKFPHMRRPHRTMPERRPPP